MLFESGNQKLAYGHIISFSPPDDHHSFVFSDGFISSRTILKNFKNIDPSSKYLHCLFQIYPHFLNSCKKAALNLEEELKSKSSELNDQKKREIIQERIEKVSHEYKFNQDTFEKVKDTPVSFDNPVQLLHIASNKFLSCNYAEADFEKENFRLELSEYPSENTFLKFLPVYTYQKRNEGVIYLRDTVYLVMSSQYLNKIPYLHISVDFSKSKAKLLKDESMVPGIDLEKSVRINDTDEVKITFNDSDGKFDSVQNEDLDEENPVERNITGIIGKPGKSLKLGNNESDEKARKAILKSKIRNPEGRSVNFKNLKSITLRSENYPLSSAKKSDMGSPDSVGNLNYVAKREINVSLDSKSLWKINLSRLNITEKNILCYGDIVWLNYSEKNATLIATEISQPKQQVFGFSLSKNPAYIVKFVSSMFAEHFQNFHGETNGMWMIEHEDYMKGGMIEWGTPLRLKHLISGKYLSVEMAYSDNSQVEGKLFEMVDSPTKNTLFEFTILPTTISKGNPIYTKYIPKDAFIKLKHVTNKSWIRLNYNEVPMHEDKKHLDNCKSGLTEIAGDEIAFKIFQANEDEVWETNFLISCKPFLIAMLQYLKNFSKDKDRDKKV